MRNFYVLIAAGVICVVAMFVALGGKGGGYVYRNAEQGGIGGVPAPPSSDQPEAASKDVEFPPYPVESLVKNPSGLAYLDLKIGEGRVPSLGDKVTVHYIGQLKDTKEVFDSDMGGNPTEFTLGQVIEGWNEGLQGMHEGGERVLVIPSALAYGQAGREPKIPPNADLEFDVKLIKVTPKAQ
jgi:peptidylprolyl isomerase